MVDKKEYMCYSLKKYRGNICLNFSTTITIIIQTHIIWVSFLLLKIYNSF